MYKGRPGRKERERIYVQVQPPDEPFHNIGALKSVDRRILCSSGTSCEGFKSSKIVKGLVGLSSPTETNCFPFTFMTGNIKILPQNSTSSFRPRKRKVGKKEITHKECQQSIFKLLKLTFIREKEEANYYYSYSLLFFKIYYLKDFFSIC